jgi:hypothetical protein
LQRFRICQHLICREFEDVFEPSHKQIDPNLKYAVAKEGIYMKTIFRSVILGLLIAALLALGAVASFAQDPCTDADGMTKMSEDFNKLFPDKSVEGRKKAIDVGKQFLEKYGSCEAGKDLAEYLKKNIPVMETALKNQQAQAEENALVARFNTALKASNWDEVYASGKDVLAKYPDKYRDVEILLGLIGLDETGKTPRVTKWNDDTLRYAKMSIADINSGKTFSKDFGVAPFAHKTKDEALAELNYAIGYILMYDKANKKEAVTYLFKAAQLTSDIKNNPVLYQAIGSMYFDDVKKLAAEVDAMAKAQNPADPEDVAKQKVDAIKAKVAMVNGTAEAAIDAYARAWKLAKDNPKMNKAYVDDLYKTLQSLYNVRFGKAEGLDAFIATTVAKPLRDPSSPVTPISDPEPATTPSASTATPTGTVNGTAPGAVKPAGNTTTTVKPAATPTTTTTKPATPPVKKPGTKRLAVVKKPVKKAA